MRLVDFCLICDCMQQRIIEANDRRCGTTNILPSQCVILSDDTGAVINPQITLVEA